MVIRTIILITMPELGEFRKQTLGERIRARMEYTFRPTGPISKEVTRQITKIQEVIPYGEAWEAFEKAKHGVPQKLQTTDEAFRKESYWHNLTKFVKLFFYAPIVVLLDGASPASKERKKIRKAAKEWKQYFSHTPEGKRVVASLNGNTERHKRIDEIVMRIAAGQLPGGTR